MHKLRVGILRGGVNNHYEASLETGSLALANLDKQKYQPIDLFLDREGNLHHRGVPISFADLSSLVDVVFNALHGSLGEDGKITGVLNRLNIPIIASPPLTSAVFSNKKLAKEFFERHGIKTPKFIALSREEFKTGNRDVFVREVTYRMSPPWVIKPISGELGEHVVTVRDRHELLITLARMFQIYDTVLIEEEVKGKEYSVGVIESFRSEPHYQALAIECIRTPEGKSLCVSRMSPEDRAEIKRITDAIFGNNRGYHYGIVDIIMTRQGALVLEVNDQPRLSSEAPFGRSLEESGISWGEFFDHQIALALGNK